MGVPGPTTAYRWKSIEVIATTPDVIYALIYVDTLVVIIYTMLAYAEDQYQLANRSKAKVEPKQWFTRRLG